MITYEGFKVVIEAVNAVAALVFAALGALEYGRRGITARAALYVALAALFAPA